MQMDAVTFNNGHNKTYQKKPRIKSSTFSQVVLKSDVGEFQDGIFVAAEAIKENQQPMNRNRNYPRTTEKPSLERPKSETTLQGRPTQQYREHSSGSLQHSNVHFASPQGDSYHVSKERTSPSRSPHRRHSPPQAGYVDNHGNTSLSPPKPRQPHVETPESSNRGGSPPKDKSPAPSRWAGPAFSNAPPPSSLPLPDFPPFAPQQSPPSSSSPSPSSSPSSSPPQTHYLSPALPASQPPVLYQEYYYPVYAPLPPHPAYFSSYAYALSPAPPLDQLSMDLRRMLHIEQQPVPPILA